MAQRVNDNQQGESRRRAKAAARVVALAFAGCMLAGCASGGAQMSAFVDPAKYLAYDCPQLNNARKAVFQRVSELQGLMSKAEQGAGGALMSGLAYQTEYLSSRDDLSLLDEARRQNNCPDVSMMPDEPPDEKKSEAPARAKTKK